MAIKITVDTQDATNQEVRYFKDKFPMIDDMKREGRKWGIQYMELEYDSGEVGRKCPFLKEKSPSFIQVAAAFLFSFMVATITLQSLWNWFIAPLGINELSSLHSAGLLLFTIAIKIVLCNLK